MEEEVSRSQEVENTRLGLVKKREASGASLKVGGLGRAYGDARGGGEGLADDGNGVGGYSRRIEVLGWIERERMPTRVC